MKELNNKIILFTKPGCNKCNIIKTIFEKNNMDFKIIDVSENLDELEKLIKLNILTLPVIFENETFIDDFDIILEKYKK